MEIAPYVLHCPKTQENQSTWLDSWVHRVPEIGHRPLGRGNSLWRSACLILWSKPILLRYFTKIAPLCSLALRHGNTNVPVWTHESIGYPKVDISHWDAVIHYGVQLAQYCDPTLTFNAISRRSPPVYSLALILRNSKVPVWTHESIGYPKMDISHSDADIHYSVQLPQCCDPTRSFNAISRRSPPVYSFALRLRNTKVSVWTHESIGYTKIDSAIGTRQFTMAFSLPNIVIQPYLVTLFHEDCPSCTLLPYCPKTQEHQSTCVDSWVHRVPENGHQPLGRGNSLWRSPCQILWSNPILLRYFTEIASNVIPCPKTQEHQSTCVDSWVHRLPENVHQPLGRSNSLWRSACPILWSKPIFLSYFTKISPICAPLP